MAGKRRVVKKNGSKSGNKVRTTRTQKDRAKRTTRSRPATPPSPPLSGEAPSSIAPNQT